MIISRRRTTAVVALFVAAAPVSCSSSASEVPRGPGPTSSASSPLISGAPSGTGTPADAATTRAVTSAFTTFFNPASSAAASEAALQHGSAFATTLADEAKSAQSQDVSATVTAVRALGPDLAAVTFNLVSGGSPLLSNVAGNAVREGGRWKVAAVTFCNLLTLQGSPPAACSDPSITALPH